MNKVRKCAILASVALAGVSGTRAFAQSTEQQKLTASDPAGGDKFGRSVSVSADTVLVGTVHDDCAAGDYCGSASVFRFNGTTWVEEQELTASDAGWQDRFGVSVSVDGDTALVGAHYDGCAAGGLCGSAYVFRFNGSSWIEEQKLTASDAGDGKMFGLSVSVSGDTALVGWRADGCATGDECGSAYVFRYNGESWVEEQKLTASDAGANDRFGRFVSVSGDVALVAAFDDDCAAGISCGSAYVFRYNGDYWVEEQKLTASDAAFGDHFGYSVSLSESTALVGAVGDDCEAGFQCGSAYVFRFNGTSWIEQEKLTAFDPEAGEVFGASVSVSGDTVVVGAIEEDYAAGDIWGSAYVFRFDGTSWVDRQRLTASDGGGQPDSFATSVSVSGYTTVVGAYRNDCAAGDDCGSAYVFQQSGGVDPVPAVSEWSVAVMALLTLTAGTLVLARRGKAALGN